LEELVKRRGEPLYTQLKDILIEKIRSGVFRDGKLLPVRQVAETYDVSVNTVLRAYNELQKDGFVIGNVGRGTFIIADQESLKSQNRETLLRNLIKHSLEEAVANDFTMEEYERAVREYINQQKTLFSRVHVVFIECNIEQLRYFSNHLELDPSIHTIPILLSELEESPKEARKKLQGCDLILTSFYHMSEVNGYVGSLEKQIIGVNLEPELGTIVELAKISPESRIGIVTTTNRFKSIVKEIIESLGLRFKEVLETNTKDEEKIHRLVANCDSIVVSPTQREVVEKYVQAGTKVIEFVFAPDRTSINNIKVALLELKKNQK
jgi:DNA-binding transcriptional regulator YhcF (GntR family)